ncbi:MAG: oligosaccharide flippase family protein [Rudaea sp.]|uniref:oligosaccharide flippase family protein n=1 Tax=Rudaea sp. TaxID=2136325 RepID=UPI0039E34318
MADERRPGVATHSVRFLTGNVLGMIVGFVSFPIMTRLLDTKEYGIFGVYDVWLAALVAIFKFGAQHAILRFYPHTGGEKAFERYGTSVIAAPFLTACICWLLALGIHFVIVQLALPESVGIGWLMLALLPPTIWISYANSYLLAIDRSDLLVCVTVGQRLFEAGAVLALVYFVSRSAISVYGGRLLVTVGLASILGVWMLRRLHVSRRNFKGVLYRQSLAYGLPLSANEISGLLLAFIDRIMLLHILGNFAAVGVYTIGYGLAMNTSYLLNNAMNIAYSQVSIREFEMYGAAAVVRTKRALLHVFVYVIVVIIVGLVCVGKDALLLLAGDKNAASAPVFIVVGITYVLDSILGICGSGLLLHKRSSTVFALTLTFLLFNVLLNWFWIPLFGSMGAAYATLVCYVGLRLVSYFFCPAELRALPDFRSTSTAVVLGALLWVLATYTRLFDLTSHLARLGCMAVMILVVYVGLALLLDRQLRQSVFDYLHGLRLSNTGVG